MFPAFRPSVSSQLGLPGVAAGDDQLPAAVFLELRRQAVEADLTGAWPRWERVEPPTLGFEGQRRLLESVRSTSQLEIPILQT